MHADHYLDIVGLRYLFPWGEAAPDPLPVHLPPGARDRLDALATAVSERPGFFDAAFDAREYDPEVPLRIGPFSIRFVRGRHYIPAWGVIVEAPDGSRLGYTGDTGPSESVVARMRGVDLLLIEAGLRLPSHDDPERGHLTAEEAIDMAVRSRGPLGAPRPLRAGPPAPSSRGCATPSVRSSAGGGRPDRSRSARRVVTGPARPRPRPMCRAPPRAPLPRATGSPPHAASVDSPAAVRQNAAASVAAPTPSAAVAAASSSGMARAASPDAARWTAIRLTIIGSPRRLEAVRETGVEDAAARWSSSRT